MYEKQVSQHGVSIQDMIGTEIIKGFKEFDLTLDQVEQKINDNFEKGLIDDDLFEKAMDQLDIIKSKSKDGKYANTAANRKAGIVGKDYEKRKGLQHISEPLKEIKQDLEDKKSKQSDSEDSSGSVQTVQQKYDSALDSLYNKAKDLTEDDISEILHGEDDKGVPYFRGENHSRASVALKSILNTKSSDKLKNDRFLLQKDISNIRGAVDRYKASKK